MPIVSYVKHLMLKNPQENKQKTTKTKLHATSALAYICTTHYGSSSSLPHKHNTVQCVCLLSFDLASRAHSYLEAQPGGVLADGRNAYKCKQSHLKAAENAAHTLLATEHTRRYSLKGFCLQTLPTHSPLSWLMDECMMLSDWTLGGRGGIWLPAGQRWHESEITVGTVEICLLYLQSILALKLWNTGHKMSVSQSHSS